MILRISYNVLRGFPSNKGYRDREIARSVRRLRMTDSDLKEAFILFFNEGIEPDITVHDISYHDLTTVFEMSPLTAILFLDWLRKEPDIAFDTLRMRSPMDLEGFETVIKEQITPAVPEKEEDSSDITIEIK